MKNKKTIWGLLLIVLAILIGIDKLGLIGDTPLVKMIFVLGLGFVGIKSLMKLEFYGFFLPLAIIGILYSEELKITALTPWIILIALLLSTGFNLIFKDRRRSWNDNFGSDKLIDYNDRGYLKLDVLFAETIKYLENKNLKRMDIDTNFSEVRLYFQDVVWENGKGIIEIDANFSGVNLYIPKEWKLENNLDTIFSGIKENGYTNNPGGSTVILQGNLHFSGLDIYYI